MTERFVVIDVETANPDMSSICQVGMAVYENGERVASHSILIDPEDEFDEFNIAIHGITPDQVQGKPNFSEAHHAHRRRSRSEAISWLRQKQQAPKSRRANTKRAPITHTG